jgi:hypothetical protein
MSTGPISPQTSDFCQNLRQSSAPIREAFSQLEREARNILTNELSEATNNNINEAAQAGAQAVSSTPITSALGQVAGIVEAHIRALPNQCTSGSSANPNISDP